MAHRGLQSHGFGSFQPDQSFPTGGGGGSAPPKPRPPTARDLRKDAEAKARSKRNREGKPQLRKGGVFGRGTETAAQFREGQRLRKLRKEGKITEAEFRAAFAPVEQGPTGEQIREQAAGALGAEGAFEEVTPTEVSLDPTQQPGGEIAGIGKIVAATQNILFNAEAKGWIPDLSDRDPITGEEAFPTPITEETLREAALRQISVNAFDEGISRQESVGIIIEALPIVGNRARAWASGLIEQPSDNAQTVFQTIKGIGEDSTNSQEKVRSGLMKAPFAMNRVREMEEDVAGFEGRLKLLIQGSEVLKANTDVVNDMQVAIFDAKIRINNFRAAASFALTAELTGTGRIVPTDEQMFFELKEFNEGKK